MTENKPSMAFWVLAGLALVWNVIGLFAFISQVTISPEILSAMPAVERELYEELPSWVNVAFGISVVAGTLGCICLLLNKPSAAFPLFVASLLTVVCQMTYVAFFSRSVEVFGPSTLILPSLVIIVAALLVWWSKKLNT